METDFPSASYDIISVLQTASTTEAMRAAWAKADCGGYVAANKIIAHGTVPEIDITLGLCIRAKN